MRGELEDWQEDLRILYVACTRPRDYLVLSAALDDGFAARNTWMLTLAERFDPASGDCIAGDVPVEKRPAIRVFNAGHPPPGLTGDNERGAHGA